jgi:hypothetical protein
MINYLTAFFYLSALLGYNFDYLDLNLVGQKNIENIFYMSELKEKEGIASLLENAGKIDILAPQFYGVSPELKFPTFTNVPLQ